MHTITMTKNGALSLDNHPRHTAEGRAVCKALETLGDDKPRCFEVMEEWRRVVTHKSSYGIYPTSRLPQEINSLATRIRRFRRMRRSRRASGDPLRNRKPLDFEPRAADLIMKKMQAEIGGANYKTYSAPIFELRGAMKPGERCKVTIYLSKKKPKKRESNAPDYWTMNFQTEISPMEWYRLYKRGLALINKQIVLGLYGENPNLLRVLVLDETSGKLLERVAEVENDTFKSWVISKGQVNATAYEAFGRVS